MGRLLWERAGNGRTVLAALLLVCTGLFAGREFLLFVMAGGQQAGAAELMTYACTQDLFVWALPVAAAIVCKAGVWEELESGCVLFSLPRTGRRMYIWRQTAIPMIAAFAVCFLAFIVLGAVYAVCLCFGEAARPVWPADRMQWMALARLLIRIVLVSALWAQVSGLAVLAVKSVYAALAVPFVFCYVMVIFGRRYYPSWTALSPVGWMRGGTADVAGLLIFLAMAVAGYVILLKWRIAHV